MKGPLDDSGFGVVHAGPTAINDLPELIRRRGEGRALVIIDGWTAADAHRYVEAVIDNSRIPTQVVSASNTIATQRVRLELAERLSTYAGGALISVGSTEIIAAGKALAALATNGPKLTNRGGSTLRVAPRTHIAVPIGLGPAEERISVLTINDGSEQTVVDDRLLALAVIDERLFPHQDPNVDYYRNRAIALAVCTVTDDAKPLRDQTLALSAAHILVKSDLRPADVRLALTYATASHPCYPLCARCKGGTIVTTAVSGRGQASPPQLCLQQALARGLFGAKNA